MPRPKTPPKEKPSKSTAAEIDFRVTEVLNLLLEGRTRTFILRFASEKWGVSERQGEEYLRRASDALKELNKVTIQENMAIITEQLWETMRRARAAMDENLVLKTLTQLGKIKGLEKNTIVIEDKRELEHLTDAELDAIINGTTTSASDDDDEYDS